MDNSVFIDALAPILTRVAPESCWIKRNGQAPKHIKTGLNRSRLLQHFGSGPFYGAAPMSPGSSTTQIALLDFDNHDGTYDWEDTVRVVLEVIKEAELAGLRPIPFRSSGGAGVHLYFIWNDRQDAHSVRAALDTVLGHCLLKNGTKGLVAAEVEIFPKQNSVPEDGWGNMFVLPLAKNSVPLELLDLTPVAREELSAIAWRVSDPVAIVEVAPTPVRENSNDVNLDELKRALAAIPNDDLTPLPYDDWRNVIFGLHHATEGSAEGLALAHEFSAKSEKYNAEFLNDCVWPYIKEHHSTDRGAITSRTIVAMARDYGFVEDTVTQFDVVTPKETEGSIDLPVFERNKDGSILSSISNLHYALSSPEVCGLHIRYDEFKDETMLAPNGTEDWRPLTDKAVTDMRIYLERNGFKPIPKTDMRDVFDKVAHDNSFDSAIHWLENIPKWDGVKRVGTFLHRYCGTVDTPYSRAVSKYMWSALAGRVLQPGVKADMAPILVGPQGAGKTQGIKALVPAEEFYAEIDLDVKEDNLARKMRGKLVGEMEELRGMTTRESNNVKAFLSRTHEEWVPKFREFAMKYPRRLLLIGSANNDDILTDETGNRRHLPIHVTTVSVADIERDRLQLWAEGALIFKKNGVVWSEAMTLAVEEHDQFVTHDSWEDRIGEWLNESGLEDETTNGDKPFSTREVLCGALGYELKQISRREDVRMNKLLVKMGFTRTSHRTAEGPRKLWKIE